MLGTAYLSPPAAIITMIELTSEIIRNTKVRLMLAVSFPRSVVPLPITHPPHPHFFTQLIVSADPIPISMLNMGATPQPSPALPQANTPPTAICG